MSVVMNSIQLALLLTSLLGSYMVMAQDDTVPISSDALMSLIGGGLGKK